MSNDIFPQVQDEAERVAETMSPRGTIFYNERGTGALVVSDQGKIVEVWESPSGDLESQHGYLDNDGWMDGTDD